VVSLALFAAVAWSLWKGREGSEEVTVAVVEVGTGKGFSGRRILASAALLAKEAPVAIEFSGGDGKSRSVSVVTENGHCIGCPFAIRLTGVGISLDDESLSSEELRKRVLVYAESARLTESQLTFYLTVDSECSGERLVSTLDLLAKSGSFYLRLPDPLDSPISKVKASSPFVAPRAHEVTLD